ncbi:MAG: oligopeptide/dipeptide ABC transporter ATP-binding protein, partial [Clostridia bacterium]
KLMKKLQQELDMGILIVTHNLGVVAEMCDKVVVLYAGKVMEVATTEQLFRSPRHAYTLGLIRSVPRIESEEKLEGIPGSLPVMSQPLQGCPFYERCSLATDACRNSENTVLREVAPGHLSACAHHERVCAN